MKCKNCFNWKNIFRYFNLLVLFLIYSGYFSWICEAEENMVLIPEGYFIMGYNNKNETEFGDTDSDWRSV